MELWVFGLESTLLGFLGIAVFLVPLTALLFTLRAYERFSAAGRRLLDMGGLRPRLGIRAVEAEQLS
jgi:hypothetical protein